MCHDEVVAYRYDEEARLCAAQYAASNDTVARLRKQSALKAQELGAEGVRAHRVCFSAGAWDDLRGLPARAVETGCISRGDVFELADQVRAEDRCAADLLLASFVWGWGTTGYGPRRYRSVCEAAGNQLEPSLRSALAATIDSAGAFDPIAGYAHLYGGYDEGRARPGQAPYSRLRGFGPAFFTKFLYFSTPGALILDNRLANAVYDLSRMPNLVTDSGRSVAWTPYRYAVYVHWMRQTAEAVSVNPQLLELTLFSPPGDLADEDKAAD